MSFWTSERIATLVKGAGEKLSGTKIAAQISDGCTRSAVIGYAHRHNIQLNGHWQIAPAEKQRRRLVRISKLKDRLAKFDAVTVTRANLRMKMRAGIATELTTLETEAVSAVESLAA
jgi:hypothetical protein